VPDKSSEADGWQNSHRSSRLVVEPERPRSFYFKLCVAAFPTLNFISMPSQGAAPASEKIYRVDFFVKAISGTIPNKVPWHYFHERFARACPDASLFFSSVLRKLLRKLPLYLVVIQ
jgi:hypothetical protein